MQGQQHSAGTVGHRLIQPGGRWGLQGQSGLGLQLPFAQQHQMKKLPFSRDAGTVDQIMHSNNSCRKYSEWIHGGLVKHTQCPVPPTAHVEKFLDAAAHFRVPRHHTGQSETLAAQIPIK